MSNQKLMRQLVERIMAGDAQAETEFVNTFTPSVSLVLRRNARNSMDLEDLFQETFRIALEKIRNGQVRQPERLGGFMMNTARFTAIDFYRRSERYQPHDRVVLEQEAATNPLLNMLSREKCAKIRSLIPALKSPRDRAVLQRFYLAEEDKESICDDMGISFKNFAQIIFRAKARLKEILLKDGTFDPES